MTMTMTATKMYAAVAFLFSVPLETAAALCHDDSRAAVGFDTSTWISNDCGHHSNTAQGPCVACWEVQADGIGAPRCSGARPKHITTAKHHDGRASYSGPCKRNCGTPSLYRQSCFVCIHFLSAKSSPSPSSSSSPSPSPSPSPRPSYCPCPYTSFCLGASPREPVVWQGFAASFPREHRGPPTLVQPTCPSCPAARRPVRAWGPSVHRHLGDGAPAPPTHRHAYSVSR